MQSILVIDDDESLRDTIAVVLEQEGFTLVQAADGRTGLDRALTHKPDLLLVDLRLPGMSGMEVSRRMLEIRPDIPVLLATGYVRNEDVEQARSIGIREVIWKPQTIGEMGDLLAQQLEKLVGTPS